MTISYTETTQSEIRIPLADIYQALYEFILNHEGFDEWVPEELKDVELRAVKGAASLEPQYIRIRFEATTKPWKDKEKTDGGDRQRDSDD